MEKPISDNCDLLIIGGQMRVGFLPDYKRLEILYVIIVLCYIYYTFTIKILFSFHSAEKGKSKSQVVRLEKENKKIA